MAQGEASVPVQYDYEVISSKPHDQGAFTQGLCFADGVLYEGTGLYGFSSLRRMKLTGEDLQIRLLPKHFFGEGITVFKDTIIQLTWKSKVGLVWDKKKLELIRLFSYPGEGWGITHDGRHLIMSDGSSMLFFLDPDRFELEKKILVTENDIPLTRLNELEYIHNEVWANIWQENRIVRIDPGTGKVTGWIDLEKLVAEAAPDGNDNVLNGIAYDADHERIYVTGKRWSRLFEIRIKDVLQPAR
ncbi:MAG: glutaminyl-peptide cyclotransferase [Desulfobulbaceae bacterium]|nr:glutaminyl-peptide cyclotransferase [Desulfobulbaceae bacterium]